MKNSEIKDKSVDQLKEVVTNSRKEIFNLRFQAGMGEQVSITRAKQLRKTIARALTQLNQKKKAG